MEIKPENSFGVIITYPILMHVGFIKYETALVKTNNYILGDFRINDALGRFSYQGELLPKITYLDELNKVYFDKTGKNLTFNSTSSGGRTRTSFDTTS